MNIGDKVILTKNVGHSGLRKDMVGEVFEIDNDDEGYPYKLKFGEEILWLHKSRYEATGSSAILEVGDEIIVTDDTHYDHASVGTIGTIAEVDRNDSYRPYLIRFINGNETWLKADMYRKHDPKPVTEELGLGDKVIITKAQVSNGVEVGDIGKVVSIDEGDAYPYCIDINGSNIWLLPTAYEPYVEAKPKELGLGDKVLITTATPAFKIAIGDIGTITEVDSADVGTPHRIQVGAKSPVWIPRSRYEPYVEDKLQARNTTNLQVSDSRHLIDIGIAMEQDSWSTTVETQKALLGDINLLHTLIDNKDDIWERLEILVHEESMSVFDAVVLVIGELNE